MNTFRLPDYSPSLTTLIERKYTTYITSALFAENTLRTLRETDTFFYFSLSFISLSAAVPSADIPRFRAVNEETIKLDIELGFDTGGVLADANGTIRALWASYATPASDGEVDGVVRGMFIDDAICATGRVVRWLRHEHGRDEFCDRYGLGPFPNPGTVLLIVQSNYSYTLRND